jgi:hypothetical protein
VRRPQRSLAADIGRILKMRRTGSESGLARTSKGAGGRIGRCLFMYGMADRRDVRGRHGNSIGTKHDRRPHRPNRVRHPLVYWPGAVDESLRSTTWHVAMSREPRRRDSGQQEAVFQNLDPNDGKTRGRPLIELSFRQAIMPGTETVEQHRLISPRAGSS